MCVTAQEDGENLTEWVFQCECLHAVAFLNVWGYTCVCVCICWLICVSVCVSNLYAFRGRAASTQRVAGSIPRDPEGKAPIDGLKTPTVLCFLCAQSPLSLQPL